MERVQIPGIPPEGLILVTRPNVLTLFTLLAVLAGFGAPLWGQNIDPQKRAALIEDYFTARLLTRLNETSREKKRDSEFDYLKYRTYDGSYNNLQFVELGSADIQLMRMCPDHYGNGKSKPSRFNGPSPRAISNTLADQESPLPNARGLTNMVWQWGQFVDHDLDLTETKIPLEPMPIPVPAGDLYFDPYGTGQATISFFRSEYAPRSGWSSPRQQMNRITAWIDASNVYGSSEEVVNRLRMFSGGRLLCSEGTGGQFLPRDEDGFFLAGDVRANEQICLTSMHTLFMREHNRIAEQIQTRFPRLDDEQIFQLARRRVIAHVQAITYNEFLPALLGAGTLGPYPGYDAQIDPAIANVFSTAAYRFGHSMLSEKLWRLNNDGRPIRRGHISLADAFFNPDLLNGLGIEPYLKGLTEQRAQEVDSRLVGSVRNFLFGPPGAGGFDLAALNIQRGRDHGLPDYNTIRVAFGMPPVSDFSEITSDPMKQLELQLLYVTVDEIDPWVGMLAEDHLPGSSVGPTATAIIKDQFERIRSADRFWYQLEFKGSVLAEIESTTLGDIIERNTSLTDIPSNVFQR